MATNHTEHYQLCQWLSTDQVRRTDFNADNAKLATALAGLASGKADASALTSLSATVAQKADASALNALQNTVTALSSTVAGHTTQLQVKGNCQIYQTTYNGSGQIGSAARISFTFSAAPILVFVLKTGNVEPQLLMNGLTKGYGDLVVSWSGKTVSWYSPSSAVNQMNERGVTYRVYALLGF